MNRLQAGMIANAVIWAVLVFAVSVILRGTPYASSVLIIVGGGAAASIIVLGNILRRLN